MKKIITAVVVICLCGVWGVSAAELKVGDKAPDFSLKDSKGDTYSLNSPVFQGKVMSVLYKDPDKKDLNAHVEDALLKDPGLDRNVRYKGLDITNLKATKMPNFLLKMVVKDKQEKTDAVILLDDNYTILNLWGLKNHTSSLVILDKQRICRYVFNGQLPPAEVEKVLRIIKDYQAK